MWEWMRENASWRTDICNLSPHIFKLHREVEIYAMTRLSFSRDGMKALKVNEQGTIPDLLPLLLLLVKSKRNSLISSQSGDCMALSGSASEHTWKSHGANQHVQVKRKGIFTLKIKLLTRDKHDADHI